MKPSGSSGVSPGVGAPGAPNRMVPVGAFPKRTFANL